MKASGVGGGGGGGINPWTQVVNESGSTITNWTALSGTWASNGTEITQTDASANLRFLRFNTQIAGSTFVFQADINVVSASNPSNIGFARDVSNSSGTSNWFGVELHSNGTNVNTIGTTNTGVVDSTAINLTSAITFGTFVTLRVYVTFEIADVYINGVYLASIPAPSFIATAFDSISLYTYGSSVQFKNIKVWVPTLP